MLVFGKGELRSGNNKKEDPKETYPLSLQKTTLKFTAGHRDKSYRKKTKQKPTNQKQRDSISFIQYYYEHHMEMTVFSFLFKRNSFPFGWW